MLSPVKQYNNALSLITESRGSYSRAKSAAESSTRGRAELGFSLECACILNRTVCDQVNLPSWKLYLWLGALLCSRLSWTTSEAPSPGSLRWRQLRPQLSFRSLSSRLALPPSRPKSRTRLLELGQSYKCTVGRGRYKTQYLKHKNAMNKWRGNIN